ncbi:unnamed protein product, partial [Ascophyllum nodosum]
RGCGARISICNTRRSWPGVHSFGIESVRGPEGFSCGKFLPGRRYFLWNERH